MYSKHDLFTNGDQLRVKKYKTKNERKIKKDTLFFILKVISFVAIIVLCMSTFGGEFVMVYVIGVFALDSLVENLRARHLASKKLVKRIGCNRVSQRKRITLNIEKRDTNRTNRRSTQEIEKEQLKLATDAAKLEEELRENERLDSILSQGAMSQVEANAITCKVKAKQRIKEDKIALEKSKAEVQTKAPAKVEASVETKAPAKVKAKAKAVVRSSNRRKNKRSRQNIVKNAVSNQG